MRNLKKLVAALLVMSLVIALASTAFAYNDKKVNKFVIFKGSAYGYKKVTNNHGVNFSNVVLRKGSIARVVAEKGDWYKILIPKSNKKTEELYFKKKFTKNIDTDESFLIYSTAGTRRGSGAQQERFTIKSIAKTKIKTSGSTKLYKNGSLKSSVVKSLKKGVTVKLTGVVAYDERLNTYFEVKVSGKTGFVPANRLDRTDVYWIMKKVKVLYE